MLTDDSACVASILRTYHTWRALEHYDKSWNLGFLELWSWAELSIGIIVGCLPSLPKFFRHVGPKFHRVCGTRSGHESSAVPHPPRPDTLHRVKRPFAKYGFGPSVSDPLDDPNIQGPHLHDKYFILDEFDASPPREMNLSATVGQPGGTATARDALEYRQ